MTAARADWTVLDHDPVDRLSDNLWRVQGALPKPPLLRVMTIARRSDGDLVIHNAIALEPELMAAIEEFGRPAHLVVPSAFHRLDARRYVERYPELKVWCPEGARKKVARVVQVDGDYDQMPPDDDVSLSYVDGCNRREGMMTVRSPDGVTLVFNDLIFNMPHQSGLTGFVLKWMTRSTGGPTISRVARLLLVDDKQRLRARLEQLATLPGLRRIIVSHHQTIEEEPGRVLAEVAARL